MQITGYKLRAALKSLEMQIEAATRNFTDSLVKFPTEAKPTPDEAMNLLVGLETRVAKFQAAQAVYNTKVLVDVLGNGMTLAEAVKRNGMAGRTVALWKKASGAVSPTQRRYEPALYGDAKFVEEGKVYQVRTISDMEAIKRAVAAEKFASALRGAIAEGNATQVELDLDPTLFTE